MNSYYSSVGMIITIARQIWDETATPMLFLATPEFLEAIKNEDAVSVQFRHRIGLQYDWMSEEG